MQLKELLDGILATDAAVEVSGVVNNTQNLTAGSLFLATRGATSDRHDFLEEAVQKGASALLVSKDVSGRDLGDAVVLHTEDVNALADKIFAKFYSNPERALEMMAVSGTDGKTSVATIIQQLLGVDQCIYIGTNGMLYAGHERNSFNTTPDSSELYPVLREYADRGAKQCVMEFSSEAQHYNRLQDLKFQVMGLTNITSEHLNTHGTLENYINAKIAVFTEHLTKGGYVILNADDSHFDEVHRELMRAGVNLLTYGRGTNCDLQILNYEISMKGTDITFALNNRAVFASAAGGSSVDGVHEMGGADGAKVAEGCRIGAEKVGDMHESVASDEELANHSVCATLQIHSPLLGDFNVENLGCALLMLAASGRDVLGLTKNIEGLNIDGRLDLFRGFTETDDEFNVLVDYAHTPNGISRLLNFVGTMNDVKRKITVIGQAGERDKFKRPIVGKIVVESSDLTIFTTEDPKNEEVKAIIEDITRDLNRETHNWIEIIDRGEAIKYAIDYAEAGDLVMILGKGDEAFQKIGNIKVPYSDVEEVEKSIKARSKNAK